MAKKQVPGQSYLERVAKGGSLTMTKEERAEVDAWLGRPVTDREILRGNLDRQPTLEERWQPKREIVFPKSDQSPYAEAILQAENEIRKEQLAKLSPAERHLHGLKELQQETLRKNADAEAYKQRLADPRVSEALANLQTLKMRAAFDPNWSFAEAQAIEDAIEQISVPGACLETGLAMMKGALAIETSKRQAVLDRVKSQLAELGQEAEELTAGLEVTPVNERQQMEQAFNNCDLGTPDGAAEATRLYRLLYGGQNNGGAAV